MHASDFIIYYFVYNSHYFYSCVLYIVIEREIEQDRVKLLLKDPSLIPMSRDSSNVNGQNMKT